MAKRKNDIRTEKRLAFLMDSLVCSISIGAVMLAGAKYTNVGAKFIMTGVLNVTVILVLMSAFEMYMPTITSLRERRVCSVLSCVYTLILLLLCNWVVKSESVLFYLLLINCGVTLTAMLVSSEIFYRIMSSSRFARQRLLVIADEGSDFHRLKRLKYGVLSRFDSWYESVDTTDPEVLKWLTEEKMAEFDAVCIFDNLRDEVYEKIVKQAMRLNKEVYAVPKIIDINRSHSSYLRFDDILAVHIQNYSISPVQEMFKRAFDLVSSSIALVIAAIPMLIVAAAIKLTSPGPVFYKQLRYTKDKKEFYIYKFRTMVPDAEKLSGPTFAQKHDPRITPIGNILRATRLDELPQLFNILKGDMSVVGPRPERPFFVEQFEKEIDNYNYRFAMKAGLTSLSHVYGRYSTYIYDRTCYDLLYISNYSFWLDLKIILLTTKTILLKEAAEGEDEYKKTASKP